MGIDVTQWRIEIARYVKFVGRRRHGRGKSPGGKAASATSCSPLLALLLSFCLITAPSLLLQAGDVERNPGPPKIQTQDVLTIDDLNDVLSELYGVKAKWRNLGSLLRVNESTLAEISTEPRNFTNIRLRGMLSHWLEQVEPQPSWNAIVAALRSPIMAERRLANTLEARYCSGSQAEPVPHPAAGSQAEPTPEGSQAEPTPPPAADERPEMRELQLIKWYKGGQEKRLKIIASVTPHWRNLGFTFGIFQAELILIEQNLLDQENCCHAVLQRWLQNGSQPRDAYAVTWRGLIQALRDTSLREIADELEIALYKRSQAEPTPPPAAGGDHEKYLAACEEAMRKKGTLTQTVIPCVFVGPPRHGKTSLMRRLIGKSCKESQPSTGVAERIVQVNIQRSSSTAAEMNQSVWKELTLDNEGAKLLVDIFEDQKSHSNTSSQPSGSSSANPSATAVSQSDIQFDAEITLDMFHGILTKDQTAAHYQEYLEGACIAYLTDTGGQLEFQELLPALVSGPSVFFLVFRLDQDLNERFPVEYNDPTTGLTTSYTSSYTVAEFLLHTLASIASIGSDMGVGVQEQHDSFTPKVFFVGTYNDQVTEEERKEMDRNLSKLTDHYKNSIIQRFSKDYLFIPVNNRSPDDSDAQLVRSAVERINIRRHFEVTAPRHWLIFSMVLRKERETVMTYDDCFDVAKRCGIDTTDDLNNALRFLSTNVGLIRCFQGGSVNKDLQKIVIQDPQVLFNRITNLMFGTFTIENTDNDVYKRFRDEGMFSRSTFEKISIKEKEKLLTHKIFLQVLQHLHIIAPINECKDDVEYFMPCILARADPKRSVGDCPMTNVPKAPPLLVCFCCGYCPRGLFCALVVYLLNKSRSPWKLNIRKGIFRNQISFSVSCYDYVSLTVSSTLKFIEVSYTPGQVEPRTSDFATVCREVRCAIERGVKAVASTLHYKKYNPANLLKLGFYCPHSHPAEISFYGGDPRSLECSECKNPFQNLPKKYEVWFDKGFSLDSEVESVPPSEQVPEPQQPQTTDPPQAKKRNSEVTEGTGKRIATDSADIGSMSQTISPGPGSEHISGAAQAALAGATPFSVLTHPPVSQMKPAPAPPPDEVDTPDLIQLLKFPGKTKNFSVAKEIGIRYKQFGIFLLNDGRGAKVDAIAQKHNNVSEQINIEILQLWLDGEGRAVSWRTLVEVLNDIRLGKLATEIAEVKNVTMSA